MPKFLSSLEMKNEFARGRSQQSTRISYPTLNRTSTSSVTPPRLRLYPPSQLARRYVPLPFVALYLSVTNTKSSERSPHTHSSFLPKQARGASYSLFSQVLSILSIFPGRKRDYTKKLVLFQNKHFLFSEYKKN